jgi:hypothetical protein
VLVLGARLRVPGPDPDPDHPQELFLAAGCRGAIPEGQGVFPGWPVQIKICPGSRTPSCETSDTLTTLPPTPGVDS